MLKRLFNVVMSVRTVAVFPALAADRNLGETGFAGASVLSRPPGGPQQSPLRYLQVPLHGRQRRQDRRPFDFGRRSAVTRSGRFVRKCKLDEVSQLINVFLGDMSLVGPRPEVVNKAENFDAEARKTLAVRPASPIGPRSGTPTKGACWPAHPIPTPLTKKSSSPRS